jgi:hypothetical protein
MLFLDSGDTNKCRLEFDAKYKLSTDTSEIQIYTPTLVRIHNVIFNRLSCEQPSYDYVIRFL